MEQNKLSENSIQVLHKKSLYFPKKYLLALLGVLIVLSGIIGGIYLFNRQKEIQKSRASQEIREEFDGTVLDTSKWNVRNNCTATYTVNGTLNWNMPFGTVSCGSAIEYSKKVTGDFDVSVTVKPLNVEANKGTGELRLSFEAADGSLEISRRNDKGADTIWAMTRGLGAGTASTNGSSLDDITLKLARTFDSVSSSFNGQAWYKTGSNEFQLLKEFSGITALEGKLVLSVYRNKPDFPQVSGSFDTFVANATVVEPPVAPGPIGYWKFDEANGTIVKDSSGNGYNGNASKNTKIVGGKFKNARGYTAEFNNFTKIDSATIKNIIENFTIAFWAKRDSKFNTKGYDEIISVNNLQYAYERKGGFGAYLRILEIGGTEISCVTASETPDGDFSTSREKLKPDGQWHHIAVARNGNECLVFFDGVDKTEGKGLHQGHTPTKKSFYIGNISESSGNDSDKLLVTIDDLKLYDYARTAEQIQEDMRGPIGGSPSPSPSAPPLACATNAFVDNFDADEIDGDKWGEEVEGEKSNVDIQNLPKRSPLPFVGRLAETIKKGAKSKTWAILRSKRGVVGDFSTEVTINTFEADIKKEGQTAIAGLRVKYKSGKPPLIIKKVTSMNEGAEKSSTQLLVEKTGKSFGPKGKKAVKIAQNARVRLKLERRDKTLIGYYDLTNKNPKEYRKLFTIKGIDNGEISAIEIFTTNGSGKVINSPIRATFEDFTLGCPTEDYVPGDFAPLDTAGNIVGDGKVNILDLQALQNQLGKTSGDADWNEEYNLAVELYKDGEHKDEPVDPQVINIVDFGILIDYFKFGT